MNPPPTAILAPHLIVKPATAQLQRCQKIIDEAKNHAHREEHNAPLVNVGLVDLMKDAIACVEKVSFDHETGVVTVK